MIHKQTTTRDASAQEVVNTEASLMAHAVLGAVVAAAQGNSALAGASGAALGEYIAQQMYPGVPKDKLTEEQKQTISALGTLAAGLVGGIAGDSTADAVAGAQAGKNALENNALGDKDKDLGLQDIRPGWLRLGTLDGDGKLNLGAGKVNRPANKSSEGANGPSTNIATGFSKSPQSIWGRSTNEIVKDFTSAGYQVNVRQSTRGSGQAVIIEVKGHPEISQIQYHPRGGRHSGSYYKISTTTQGTVKVVDPSTYKPTQGEKATIIDRPKK